jgi:tubulin-specific chaperone C
VIKGLREKLDETRASFGPRSKFTFKTARKNPSAVSLSDAAELAAQKRRNLPGYSTPSTDSSFVNTPAYHRSPDRSESPAPLRVPPPTAVDESSKDASQDASDTENKDSAKLDPRAAAIRRPTFSTSSTVSITRESNTHIILPCSASHATKPCSLTSLKGCVVDISVLSPQNSAPFAGLTVKDVKKSLLVCGIVNGPAHVTGMTGSVIVVKCQQFRMHECTNVDVYLSCSSHPVIEDCSGIRFAPLPDTYVGHPCCCSTSQRYNHSMPLLTSPSASPPPPRHLSLFRRPLTLYRVPYIPHPSKKIPSNRQTSGRRLTTSNGSSKSRVQIGVSSLRKTWFLTTHGGRLSRVVQDGA